MKIVSFLGSATEIVFELGLGDSLVGVSHECDYPPQARLLPRVSRPRFDPAGLPSGEVDAAVRRSMEEYGSVYEVDQALLASLAPTVVLTQAVCEVCAVPTGSVDEVVARLPRPPRVVSLDAHTLDEIIETIRLVAGAAGVPERGDALAADLRSRLSTVSGAVPTRARPRVLFLEWLDPPFAPGHWVPEMIERADGTNLIDAAGIPSRQVPWSDVEGLDPDYLLIEPCGFDLDQAYADAERHRDRLTAIAPRAIAEGKAWLLHSAWFSRSGPRVVEGVETLSEILGGSAPTGSDLAARARRWQ
jgi:iron complex transport system substrate-binding protein